jgi:hypothetical protein
MAQQVNVGEYGIAQVVIDGNVVLEQGSVTFKQMVNSSQVNTTMKGYSGKTQGSPSCTFTIESMIPRGGIEMVTLQQKAVALAPVDITFYFGASQANFTGFVNDFDSSHSVGQNAKIVMSGDGPYVEFEAI